MVKSYLSPIPLAVFLLAVAGGCGEPAGYPMGLEVFDSDLRLELIAEAPDIMTPIGLAIDDQDALYVLESHTHTPLSDYPGPKFDRIKKGIDEDSDGKPERWVVFADSLEDGMNMAFAEGGGLYVTTKNSVLRFRDHNGDGKSDERLSILRMTRPENVYDHAGILGLTCGPDGWLYVSRGNTGGQHWQIEGADGSILSGYGDGGNVFRCHMDGSALEEVATGFWNPFDLKFIADGAEPPDRSRARRRLRL
jgi:putative membrane-bound dehydrogenase-like protein